MSERERREVEEHRGGPNLQRSRSFWDSVMVFLLGEEAEERTEGPSAQRPQSFWDSLTVFFTGETLEERRLARELGPLVGLPAKDALDQAVMHLTRAGATVTGRTGNTVSFTYHKWPNALVLLLLLLLLVVPAIIYGIAASRDVHFTVTATPAPGGCRLLFGGEYGAGYDEFHRWLRTLPEPNLGLMEEKESLRIDREASTDISTQIKKLAELRDAGLITGEEFEAKKRDLLEGM